MMFMADPWQLAALGRVTDPVRIRITKPDHPVVQELLGDSGRRLAKAGVEFIFARALAYTLMDERAAVLTKNQPCKRHDWDLSMRYRCTKCGKFYDRKNIRTICNGKPWNGLD